MEILKVSAKSNPNSVAGALAGVLRERGAAEIQAIGAGALNQAVKAVAIARGFVAPSGIDLICIPAFTDIMIDGEERSEEHTSELQSRPHLVCRLLLEKKKITKNFLLVYSSTHPFTIVAHLIQQEQITNHLDAVDDAITVVSEAHEKTVLAGFDLTESD